MAKQAVGRKARAKGLVSAMSLAVGLFSLAAPIDAAAEQRIALVIGNGDYEHAPLRNPVNDAQAMAKVLGEAGFEVTARVNLNQAEMKRAIQEFGGKLDAADGDAVGLFYFAGHGVQVEGANYLVPVGARIAREPDVDIESVNAAAVLSMMEYSKNKLNIVILDACRNNPFKRSFRSAASGLARMDAPIGSMVAYATAPGSVAADGEGDHGVYTEELIRAMRTPGARIEEVFKSTRVAVLRRTDDQQVPWESSSLTGDFYFLAPPAGGQATAPAAPQAAPLPPAPASEADDGAANRKWVDIADSKDPKVLEAFIKDFPASPLVELAKRRLGEAKQERAATAVPPTRLERPAPAPPPPPASTAKARSERERLQAELNRSLQGGVAGGAVQSAGNAPTLVDMKTGRAVTGMEAQALTAQCQMFYEQLAAMNSVIGTSRSVAQAAILQQQKSMCQRYGLTGH